MKSTDPKLDCELLLDNAATCSQVRELLRTFEGQEGPLRECVRLNVYEPLAAEITRLREALKLIAEQTICPELFPEEKDENMLQLKTAIVTAIAALDPEAGRG